MPDKVIKEHYVPQRYLRKFANGNKFFVFDKEKKQQRPGNVGDYACERFFYDIDFEELKKEKLEQDPTFKVDTEIEALMSQIDEQHIEHWFGQNVETWLFNPIDKVVSSYVMANPQKLHEINIFSDQEMNYLSLYMATQVLRSKEFRESMTEIYERLPLLLMKKKAKTDEEREFLNNLELKIKNENHKKLLHALILMDENAVADFAMDFRKKIWSIGVNNTDVPFITSDNPIVKFGHNGMQGFNSSGVEIFFPINTKLILILREPEFFWYEFENNNHFVDLEKDEVEFMNSLQVQQSYRYVFSHQDDYSLVEGMMKRNPQLSDIRHKRFLMG